MRITYYVVQPFVEGSRGLLAEEALAPPDKDAALNLGRRLADTKAGVLVFSRSGDPDLGEYEDAKILARFGQIPAELD